MKNNAKITGIKKSGLEAGMIKFIDSIEPPLKAGSYTLEASQAISGVTNDDADQDEDQTGPVDGITIDPETNLPIYSTQRPIQVKGTQFTIKPSTVHAVYPPPVSVGGYGDSLPNLVLTDFALPWSRPVDPANPEANVDTPWMGLLTIHADEVKQLSEPQVVTVQQLLEPGPGIQGPLLNKQDLNGMMQDKVTVVDMDFKLFQSISPTLEDLEFLAHGREVNTGGKVMLGMDADGLFSLLIGNRLPMGGESGAPPVENYIYAVSYEGHSTHLRGNSPPPCTITKIRLVVLYSWKFKELPVTSSFLGEMKALCDPGNGGVRLMQMPGNLEQINQEPKTDGKEIAEKALRIGYTALQNDMRAGEQATSWYRGPLVPTPTKRQSEMVYGTYLYSDHAIHYDPKTGIFDHSYASAWQIGRLLALSDGVFARALFEWRNSFVLIAFQMATSKTITANIRTLAGEDRDDPVATRDLDSGLKFGLVKSFISQPVPKAATRDQKMLGTHLPGVLSEQQQELLLEKDEDPLLTLLNKS